MPACAPAADLADLRRLQRAAAGLASTVSEHRVNNEQLLTARQSLRRPARTTPPTCSPPAAMPRTSFRWRDEHWQRHGSGYWVIRSRDSHRPEAILGFCGLKLMPFNDTTVLNLSYRLDPPVRGNGVATEAAAAVVAWATSHFPGRPIIARVRPNNIASARVAARAGRPRRVWPGSG